MYQYLSDVQKRRLFNAVFASFVLLAVFLGAQTFNALKENNYIGRGTYAANVISVNGTGEVFAVPDTATFSFTVTEEGKTVKAAQDVATKKINSLIDAIKALGVDEKDIKTVGYNSYPKYEYTKSVICENGYCPPGRQILTGYEVSQSISVKVRKTEDAGTILTKVGDLGATNISGVDFVIDDIDTVQNQARDKAIAEAKDKAKTLSKSLGVRLVKIVNFQEGGATPIYFGMTKTADSIGMGGAVESVPPQLPTGENKITSSITITYEVE